MSKKNNKSSKAFVDIKQDMNMGVRNYANFCLLWNIILLKAFLQVSSKNVNMKTMTRKFSTAF